MERKIEELLKNPASEYRGKPFWAWNGELDESELLRQVEAFHEMGFGGFFIHSRTGLKTEYLGEKWFDMVRKCALRAKELGMEAWLYDEDRWPSGTCGGEVTKERKNRLRFVSLYDSDEEALACKEVAGILSRYAVRLEKDRAGEERLLDYYSVNSASEVREGYRYAVFAEEEQSCSDFYNGYTYIDTMNREVTEQFIRSTHEKYAAACGDLFGNTIKGIFTDEPHRGSLFTGFTITNANRSRMAPYTEKLPQAYREKYGREIEWPLLYWRRRGESFNRTAEEYIDVADDLFTQNFARPCQEWCEKHGLKQTGHILHEDSVSIQASVTGSCMRYYEYMDYPGIDVLTEHNNVYWAAKQCSSVARQLGKKFVLSELYGATGWDMTLNRYKTCGDWQALFGINFRCPHLSLYTMKGESKRDYPASILHQNAWYREWKILEDYFARLSVLSAEGERICDTLVMTPIREMWGNVHLGWMEGLAPSDKNAVAIDEAYIKQFKELTARGIDFDYGDEELLRKYGSVVRENGRTYLQLGKIRYTEVLWRETDRISEGARSLLAEFAAEGGRLTEDISELSPENRFRGPEGTASAAYRLGEDVWVFLLNLDKENGTEGALELPEEYRSRNAEIWNFREGKSEGQVRIQGGKIPLSLCGGEEFILRLTKEKTAAAPKRGEYPLLSLPESFAYELTEPNVLPLDEGVWAEDGIVQNGGAPKNILLIDREIRSKRGRQVRGGEMLQPWYAEKYGASKQPYKLCDLKLSFTFEAEYLPEGEVYLAKEDSGLTYTVNGVPLGEKSDRYWADSCFKLYPVRLRRGENKIEVSGAFFEADGLEAVYLLGNFGVKLPSVLTKLPDRLKAGDISPQGLPYYTGSVLYHTGIAQGKYRLSFKKLGCSVMKIHGGREAINVAFAPYEVEVEAESELVLETVFARRNTFGPLHQTYPQSCCAPDSFLTDGKDYVPFTPAPQGLPAE